MVILMTIAPPHQTRDDHGDEDEGCLGQDNNECFSFKVCDDLEEDNDHKKEKSATL